MRYLLNYALLFLAISNKSRFQNIRHLTTNSKFWETPISITHLFPFLAVHARDRQRARDAAPGGQDPRGELLRPHARQQGRTHRAIQAQGRPVHRGKNE